MKFNLELIKKIIDLPTNDTRALRNLFDDAGLEVDDVEANEGTGAVSFSVEILAHRGDHLSALGIARELSAKLQKSLKKLDLSSLPEQKHPNKISTSFKVEGEPCVSFSLMSLKLSLDFKTDFAILKFLNNVPEDRAAIVNYLNYISLELGQPMHAYDADKLEGDLVVYVSDREEKIIALNGKEYIVPENSILIRDNKKIVAAAGVIGCANTMVDKNSTNILVEAAAFDPVLVRKTARKMGLSTDASFAFERGVDPLVHTLALRRLLSLLEQSKKVYSSNNVEVFNFTSLVVDKFKKANFKINFQDLADLINENNLDKKDVVNRLQFLGYEVIESAGAKSIDVIVPSWRCWNVDVPAVVMEDYIRTYGLNKVNLSLPDLSLDRAEENSEDCVLRVVEPVLLGNGFNQVITRSYYATSDVELLKSLGVAEEIERQHVKINNAVDNGYSHLKITNILHLAKLAEWNMRHGLESVKVFEVGRLFSKNPKYNSKYEFESPVLSLAFSGRWLNNLWKKSHLVSDNYFYLKGIIESLGIATKTNFEFVPSEQEFFHPACQAEVRFNNKSCGFAGIMHPVIKERLGLSNDLVYAELSLDFLYEAIQSSQKVNTDILNSLTEFPSMKRDLTLKLPKKLFAAEVLDIINKARILDLEKAYIVDDFSKDDEDFRRTSFRLVFQSKEKTLQANEVDESFSRFVDELIVAKSWERG